MTGWLRAIRRGVRALKHDGLVSGGRENFVTVAGEEFGTNRDSLRLLIDKVEERKLMVEVGSLAGFSTRFFSLHFEHVISVDPYVPHYDMGDRNAGRTRLMIARDLFRLRFSDDPSVEQRNISSREVMKGFSNESLDFVYIDAGHDYKHVREDIVGWLPKVKPGSYIAGDDYPWEGVTRAVNEMFTDFEVLDKRWIARVPERG